MSNKTIPLRRVRRRQEIKRRMDRVLNTLLMLGQVAERYRKHLVTTHYPSGGFITKREDIHDFTGYLDKIREAACPDDYEFSCNNFPDMTLPCDNTPYQGFYGTDCKGKIEHISLVQNAVEEYKKLHPNWAAEMGRRALNPSNYSIINPLTITLP